MTKKKKINIPNMLLALVIATGLWIYCIIEINPTSDVTIKGVPISYVGAEELSSQGLAIISEKPEVINLTIGGQRAAISKAKASDFAVVCDLESLQEGDNRISINVTAPDGIQVENQSIKSLSLTVEKIVSSVKNIAGIIINQEADSDTAEILSMSKTTVKVTGPKSIVNSVARVVARVDATMLGNEPLILQVPLEAVDSEGKSVDGVTLGRASISCKAILVSSVIVDPLDEPDIEEEGNDGTTDEGDITEEDEAEQDAADGTDGVGGDEGTADESDAQGELPEETDDNADADNTEE